MQHKNGEPLLQGAEANDVGEARGLQLSVGRTVHVCGGGSCRGCWLRGRRTDPVMATAQAVLFLLVVYITASNNCRTTSPRPFVVRLCVATS